MQDDFRTVAVLFELPKLIFFFPDDKAVSVCNGSVFSLIFIFWMVLTIHHLFLLAHSSYG